MVSGGSKSRRDSRSSRAVGRSGGRAVGVSDTSESRTAVVFAATGSTVTDSVSPSDRWLSRSNARTERISSPHHSILVGAAMPNPYTSKMPPRTANWATSSTVGRRSYPIPSSTSIAWAGLRSSPTARVSCIDRTARGIAVSSPVARTVVTTTDTSPLNRASTVSTRSPAISQCGSSSPSASRCGYRRTRASISTDRSANHRSASAGPDVTTRNVRWGRCSARDASITATPPPGRPPTLTDAPREGSFPTKPRKRGSS